MNIVRSSVAGSLMAMALIGAPVVAQASVAPATVDNTAQLLTQFTVSEQATPAGLQVAANSRIRSLLRFRSLSGNRTTYTGPATTVKATGTKSRGTPRVYNNRQRTLRQLRRIHM